ncbi:hypothetical protein V2O64_11700 [Verrucomicrobiaceae bacterium 227]
MSTLIQLTFLLSALGPAAESSTVRFDVNGASGPTQPGWVGVEPATGIGKNENYTLTLSPIVRNFNRDRKTARTEQGKNNHDNAVPTGPYAPMYQDFMFILPGKLTGTISGLAPGTTYPVTVFSWDSAQGDLNETDWGPQGKAKHRIAFTGDFTNTSQKATDPDTRSLTDYSTTFLVVADASGNLIFEGLSAGRLSIIVLNGVIVGDPVSSSAPDTAKSAPTPPP